MSLKRRFPSLFTLLAAVFFCSVGTFIQYYSTLLSGFKLMQTDVGDTRLNHYFLEHSFQWLVNSSYSGTLWSPSFFYPAKEVLAYSDNLFGAAPIYWLFRVVASAPTAFQLWMIAVSSLNFLSFFLLLKYLKIGDLFSGLGAFLFAFSLPRTAQVGHQQLLPQFFTPLALVAAFSFIKNPSKKWFTVLLVSCYLQILAGIYLGWFLLMSIPVLFLIAYGSSREAREKLFRFWKTSKTFLVSAILGWVAATALTLLPYIELSLARGGRPYEEVDTMVPRLASWFSVPAYSALSPVLSKISAGIPAFGEHQLFMGFTILFLSLGCILSLCRSSCLSGWEKQLATVCLLTFVTIFLLSLRLPSGFSLWRIVFEVVPGASAIRAVTRIWTIAYCYLLVAIFLWADRAFLRNVAATGKKRWLAATLICTVAVAEQVTMNQPSFDKYQVSQEVAEIETLIGSQCDAAYLTFPEDKPFYEAQVSAMWAGIQANVPVINGYSGLYPTGYKDFTKSMTPAELVDWLKVSGSGDDSDRVCILGKATALSGDRLIQSSAISPVQGDSSDLSLYRVQLPLNK